MSVVEIFLQPRTQFTLCHYFSDFELSNIYDRINPRKFYFFLLKSLTQKRQLWKHGLQQVKDSQKLNLVDIFQYTSNLAPWDHSHLSLQAKRHQRPHTLG